MVFSSIEFLLYFLPIFMILYGITPNAYKNLTLLAGSIIFYALGEPKYLLLLVISLVVNYLIGLDLAEESRANRKRTNKGKNKRKRLLILAVVGNVGVLMLFKGAPNELGLPLGISFYTFQILSYLIDVYQGTIKRETSIWKLSTYISMFPQLVSGPIVNYSEVEEQLSHRKLTAANIQDGLKVFTMGLASKVLLADRIGLLWNHVQMTGYQSISTPLAWMAAIGYSMKIYFDFYGYSLMAVGLGRMLGFELPQNFREPYMAKGVRDFYRRWHMTLGRWFRQYVYIPLGGNRKGELRTVLNLLVVWILTSIWHGSTLNFLMWGMMIWLCIVLERWLGRIQVLQHLRILPRVYLWTVIPVTWMCFAITDLSQLQVYLGRMFGLSEGINVNASDWLRLLADYKWLFAVCLIACTPVVRKVYHKIKDNIVGEILLGILFWVCVVQLIVAGENTFMYFRF